MTTFTSGQTISLSLDSDDYVSFSGQGVATITPASGSPFVTYLTGSQTLGPYKMLVTISIATSSAGTYTQQSLIDVATHAVYSTDTSGNVTGLVGLSVLPPGNIRAGALGDSTIAGVLQSADAITVQVGSAYAAAYPPAKIGFERGAATSWFTHACLQSNGRLINNHNGGVSSDTSAGCLSRLAYEISQSPQIMFLQMGIRNDINLSVPTATSRANMQSAVTQLLNAGIVPILVTCMPDNTASIGTAIRAWNEWLKWFALSKNIPLVDPHAVLVDPANTSGNWLAAYTADGVHPNTIGASVAAAAVLNQLQAIGLVGSIPAAYTFSRLADTNLGVGVNSAANLFYNPLFNQNSGAVTATSWTNSGTNSPSINTSPGAGIIGSSQVITFAAGNTLVWYGQQVTTVVGHRYAMSGLFKTSGMQAAAGVYSIGAPTSIGGPTCAVMVAQNLTGVDFTNWTPFYIEYVAQTTTTRFQLASVPTSIGGAATLEFAMARCIDLDAM